MYMKKKFCCCLSFLVFVVQVIQLNAQPKLSAAFYYSHGIVVDSKGNAFVTGKNDKIIKIDPAGKAELFAGGGSDYIDGTGTNVRFAYTDGIAIDSADNLYVADGSRIRKISPDATVITIAGTLS